MIAMVHGTLLEKGPESALVEAGGLGYEVFLPAPALQALPAPGQAVRLYTHFHVREDAQVLYGFLEPGERQAFLLLLTVKGVGPKVALGILSGLSAAELAGALQRRDVAALTRVPGVGKKLAERLGVELSDKARQLGPGSPAAAAPALEEGGPWEQGVEAMRRLGYSAPQARAAVAAVRQAYPGQAPPVPELVRLALKEV